MRTAIALDLTSIRPVVGNDLPPPPPPPPPPPTDTTAPTITSANPSGTYDEGVAVSGTLTANETVTWSKSGTDASRVTLNATTGVWSLESTDYETKTSYSWTFTATDGASNATNQVVSISITDVDDVAPTLSSPTDATDGATAMAGSVSTTEGNGTLYWFISTSATPPSAANLKAGLGATAAGFQAVSGTGTQNISDSGLTAETTYYTHYLHRDAAGNDSAIASADGFTTEEAPAGLPTFALQSETTAIQSAHSAAGYTTPIRELRQLDYWIRKLKAAGTWDKFTGGGWWVQTGTANASLVNLHTPGTHDLTITGTPTFTALTQTFHAPQDITNKGFKANASGDRLSTGITLASLSGQNASIAVFVGKGAAGGADAGARDGLMGLEVRSYETGINSMNGRAMGATIGSQLASVYYDGYGMHAMAREGGNVVSYRNGRLHKTTAQAAQTTTSTNPLIFLGITGSTTSSNKTWQAGYVGIDLTAADHDLIYRATRSIIEGAMYGRALIHEPGYALDNDTFDLLVYGWGAGAVMAAVEAKRRGLSVAMVGGWRDVTSSQIGGMSANNLGAIDLTNTETFRGLGRLWLQHNLRAMGASASSLGTITKATNPRMAALQFKAFLDPDMAVGFDIPLFAGCMVDSVGWTGTDVTSMTTTDGRTFHFNSWHDDTEEGDLAAAAGIPFITGREAGSDPSGYRGNLLTFGAEVAQPSSPFGSTYYAISPWVDGSTPASGRIFGVEADSGTTLNAADNRTMNFCFRGSFTSARSRQQPFETSAPAGYSDAKYEGLFRLADAAGSGFAATDCMKLTATSDVHIDSNNQGTFSHNLMGSGTAYVAAGNDLTVRESVWKSVEEWQRGLIWAVTGSADSRISGTAARTTLLTYGYPSDAFLDPHPNDSPYWPTVLYRRLVRRMEGMLKLEKANLTATLLSTNVAATSSYSMDWHSTHLFADESTSPDQIHAEGGFFIDTGSAQDYAPLPFEIFIPKGTVCTNGSWSFAASTNSLAFGNIRMEPTRMMVGQACGVAHAFAQANSYTIQDACTTHYGNNSTGLRALLLNCATLPNESELKIPQAFTADFST